MDTELVKDIFAATATHQEPVYINRLGPKKEGKIRPLIIRMQNSDEKEAFMSRWMLKNVRMKFKNVSITNDYTLDERMMIRRCVEEAKRRNTSGTNGYLWKVRGTPKTGLKIVKIETNDYERQARPQTTINDLRRRVS